MSHASWDCDCSEWLRAELWARNWSHICTVFAAVAACRQAHEEGAATIPYDYWGARFKPLEGK